MTYDFDVMLICILDWGMLFVVSITSFAYFQVSHVRQANNRIQDKTVCPTNSRLAATMTNTPFTIAHAIDLALLAVRSRWQEFQRALAAPLVLYALMNLVSHSWWNGIVGVLVIQMVNCALLTVIAVKTHRLVLLGDEAVPNWSLGPWTMRESRFFGYLVGIFVGVRVGMDVSALMGSLATLLFVLFVGWVLCRVCFLFPAMATDEPITIPKAWTMTKRYQLPLVVCLFVIPILIGIPVTTLFGKLLILGPLLQPILAVATIGVLSTAYALVREAMID